MSDKALSFWQDIDAHVQASAHLYRPIRGTMIAYDDDGDSIFEKFFLPDSADDDAIPLEIVTMRGWDLPDITFGDVWHYIWVLPIGNSQVLYLGSVQDPSLSATQNIEGRVNIGTRLDVNEDLHVTDDATFSSDINVTNGTVFAQNVETTGTIKGVSQSFVFAEKTQSSSSTPSSTNTSTFVDAITNTIVLPAGTWTLYVSGGINAIHSVAGGGWRVQSVCDSVVGQINVPPPAQTAGYTTGFTSDTYTSVTGNRTVTCQIQYRPNSAGTCTTTNPFIMIRAVRTA